MSSNVDRICNYFLFCPLYSIGRIFRDQTEALGVKGLTKYMVLFQGSNKSFRVHFVVLKHTPPPHLVLKNRKLHQYWKDGFILNTSWPLDDAGHALTQRDGYLMERGLTEENDSSNPQRNPKTEVSHPYSKRISVESADFRATVVYCNMALPLASLFPNRAIAYEYYIEPVFDIDSGFL
ncbi:hypothetical protein EVAR_77900_1 [Eumeta japonica]|uniref:Uncharacterized protein n=1 Tax=Eumeta variegata TaxID=151549 RepID=A0A4C1ZB51_EUMVA|nr:hypothetical protein EVAR_77900_1 [Eumeta japonica]